MSNVNYTKEYYRLLQNLKVGQILPLEGEKIIVKDIVVYVNILPTPLNGYLTGDSSNISVEEARKIQWDKVEDREVVLCHITYTDLSEHEEDSTTLGALVEERLKICSF